MAAENDNNKKHQKLCFLQTRTVFVCPKHDHVHAFYFTLTMDESMQCFNYGTVLVVVVFQLHFA